MDNLYAKMTFEMELRGYSQHTMKHYLSHIRLIEKHLCKPLDQITPEEIKQFLQHRIKHGISYSNVDISCNAFKVMFNSVLQRNWSDDVIVRPRKPKKLPYVLSRDEILSIMEHISNIVISYLGRYTHRVAIANSRIVSFDGHTVQFKWKDYKDDNRIKLMTLEVAEFMRRFLLHILPSGFTRVRHYGLLASRNVGTKLALCIKLAGVRVVVPSLVKHGVTCPLCGHVMVFSGVINGSAAVP